VVYEVLIERSAERDLKSLPTVIYNRIVPRIRALADTPRPAGCHKLAGSKNDWRIRLGDHEHGFYPATITSLVRASANPVE
jgi:mRNA interferase RelE/StbE